MGSSETLNQRFLYIPRPALYASLIAHFAVLFGVVVNSVLEHYNIHIFGKKKPIHEMYQDYIQVDVVGLPQQLVKDMPKMDVTAPIVDNPAKSVEEPVKEATPTPAEDAMQLEAERKKEEAKKAADAKKKEEEAKKADEKKKAQERDKALKKLKEEASREAALKSLAEKKGKAGRQKIAGNLTSKGTATTGKIGDMRDKYGALLVSKIREHFNIFTWQQKKNLVAVLYLELYPTGRVRQRKIMKKSADALYDSAVLEAIDEAQPFPIPEDKAVLDEGYMIEFRPGG